MHKMADIIIIGAGIAGLTLALALRKHSNLRIMVLDAGEITKPWSYDRYGQRVSALTKSSVDFLKSLSVWEAVQQQRISPFVSIKVYEPPEQLALTFKAEDVHATELGFIVENNLLQNVLAEKAKHMPDVEIYPNVKLSHVSADDTGVSIFDESQNVYRAQLVVGADGAHSFLRKQASIEVARKSYHQSAFIAEIKTTKPHDKIARQLFLPTGPLAFLPLKDPFHTSIVWSCDDQLAHELLRLSEIQFTEKLHETFQVLGELQMIGTKKSFPLYQQLADHYVANRIALIGDAAHVVHPLAGQGANLAIKDAKILSEILQCNIQKLKDFYSLRVLKQYEREVKATHFTMLQVIDIIKTFYAIQNPIFCKMRFSGARLLEHAGLKRYIIKQAIG